MSIERIIVNGRELTAFDMPAEPSKEYSVRVDDSNEVEVAELGRGTCKVVGHGLTACDDIEFHWYALSCGHRLRTLWAADTVGMYCPECGRRVECEQ